MVVDAWLLKDEALIFGPPCGVNVK